MKKIKIILLVMIIFTACAHPVKVEQSKEFEFCQYIHLAVTGSWFEDSNDDKQREFNGIQLPAYIGYLKIIRYFEGYKIKEMSFIRKNNLPLYSAGKEIENIIKNRYISETTTHKIWKFPYDDEYFLHIFLWKLYEYKLEKIISEFYFDPYQQHKFPDPILTPDDFKYESTCIYQPFAVPPKTCEELTTSNLTNLDFLIDKMIKHEEAHDKEIGKILDLKHN